MRFDATGARRFDHRRTDVSPHGDCGTETAVVEKDGRSPQRMRGTCEHRPLTRAGQPRLHPELLHSIALPQASLNWPFYLSGGGHAGDALQRRG